MKIDDLYSMRASDAPCAAKSPAHLKHETKSHMTKIINSNAYIRWDLKREILLSNKDAYLYLHMLAHVPAHTRAHVHTCTHAHACIHTHDAMWRVRTPSRGGVLFHLHHGSTQK